MAPLDGTVLSGVEVAVGSEIAHDTSDYSGNYVHDINNSMWVETMS
jgi:hypothetical protein